MPLKMLLGKQNCFYKTIVDRQYYLTVVSLHRRTPDILHTDIPIYTLPPLFVPINILPVILGHSRLCEHNNWQRLR